MLFIRLYGRNNHSGSAATRRSHTDRSTNQMTPYIGLNPPTTTPGSKWASSLDRDGYTHIWERPLPIPDSGKNASFSVDVVPLSSIGGKTHLCRSPPGFSKSSCSQETQEDMRFFNSAAIDDHVTRMCSAFEEDHYEIQENMRSPTGRELEKKH